MRPLAFTVLLVACATEPGADTATDATTDTDVAATCADETGAPDSGCFFDGLPPVDDTADGAPVGEETGEWPRTSPAPPTGLCSDDGWCWATSRPHGLALRDVAGTGDDDVWAVGAAGIVQRFDGTRWTAAWPEPGATLSGVQVDAPGHACVVGDGGLVRCREDGAWVDLDLPTGDRLVAIDRTPGGALWVASAEAVYERRGDAWVTHPVHGGVLRALADDEVWVGDDAAWSGVRRWDGHAWAPALPVGGRVIALDGAGPGDLWGATPRGLFHVVEGDAVAVAQPEGALGTNTALVVLGPDRLALASGGDLWVGGPDGWTSASPERGVGPGAGALWASPSGTVWSVGGAGRAWAWDGDAFTAHGATDRVTFGGWSTGLATAPLGGVLFGHDSGLQRLEGDVVRTLLAPDFAYAVDRIRVHSRRIWVSGGVAGCLEAPYGCGTPLFRRDAGGRWHDGRLAGWSMWEARGPARTWADQGGCRLVRQTVDGHVDPGGGATSGSWPPTGPLDSDGGCETQRFDPLREVWGAEPALTATSAWSTEPGSDARVHHFADGAWTTWTVPGHGAVRVVGHPITGAIGVVAQDGTFGRLDPDTGALVGLVALARPGDAIAGVFEVQGEIVIAVREPSPLAGGSAVGPVVLLRWDGVRVRRERLPVDADVDAVVKEPERRTWALAGGALLVRERA